MSKVNSMTRGTFNARICGIKAGCLSHICQDAIGIHEFTDTNGERVLIGAVSDGCSGSLGSQFGAKFIIENFINEAEKLGKDGRRDSAYIRNVILALTERMTQYKPRLTQSEIVRANGIETCEEQAATLYGFIADSKRIFLALAGDGVLSINDNCFSITQQDGDVYPACLLRFHKEEWLSRIEDLYVFEEIETKRVRSLIIATDGFGNPEPAEYCGLAENPAMFILHAHCHATEQKPYEEFPGAAAFRGGDDTTIAVLGKTGSDSNDLVSHYDVETIAIKVMQLGSNGFLADRKKIQTKLIRNSAYQGKASSLKSFERDIALKEDVECYGITLQDIRKYQQQKNSIFSSRIFNGNPLETLFGISNNQQTSKRATTTTTTISSGLRVPQYAECQKKAKADPEHKSLIKKKLFSFSDICSPNYRQRHGIGFRQFGQVMYDLWHFINECHDHGLRIGNMRPQDLQMEIIRSTQPATYRFSLTDPESAAKVDNHGDLIKYYSALNVDFIHPEYADRLLIDDSARLDQDWYAYSVLCYWFVTKYDPFGEGIVKAKPDADRVYRMKHSILSRSKKVDLDEKKQIFIKRAMDRLGPKTMRLINGEVLKLKPNFLLDEFHPDKIISCSFVIIKHNNDKLCGFKRIQGYNICPYCGRG